MQGRDQVSFESFFKAAESGDLKTVQQYIEQNKDNPDAININKTCNLDGIQTALSKAAARGYTKIVQTLLAVPGIDVNVPACGFYNNTPLMQAVRGQHTEVVRALLAAPGILIDTISEYGQTALMIAAQQGSMPIVKMLLEAGAGTTYKSKFGFTAETYTNDETIRHLIQQNPPIAELEAFQKKRTFLAKTKIRPTDDAQKKEEQQEKEKQRMEILLKLSMNSAVSDIDFLLEHKDRVDDFSLLPDLILRFSNLLSSLTEGDKKLDDYSSSLMKLAAAQGHAIAKHIVDTYTEKDVDAMDVQEEKVSSTATKTKFFEARKKR